MDMKVIQHTIPKGAEPGAFIYRGSVVEATHCRIDLRGWMTRQQYSLSGRPGDGDDDAVTTKPFQLVPLVASGGADEYGFSNPESLIMAGSHSGTDEHIAVVRSTRKAGNEPSHLKCGYHWSLGMQTDIKYLCCTAKIKTHPAQLFGEDPDFGSGAASK
ncbi:MAG: asparaginase [bacterium]|nr:asparaginase [bacterium]